MTMPHIVGKYEIVDAIGAGGMGTVYRAFDPTLERMVALKIVHLDRVQDVAPEQLRERFRNEAADMLTVRTIICAQDARWTKCGAA